MNLKKIKKKLENAFNELQNAAIISKENPDNEDAKKLYYDLLEDYKKGLSDFQNAGGNIEDLKFLNDNETPDNETPDNETPDNETPELITHKRIIEHKKIITHKRIIEYKEV